MSDFKTGELRRHTRVATVPSESSKKDYTVTVMVLCTCMGNTFTGHCKHSDAILAKLDES